MNSHVHSKQQLHHHHSHHHHNTNHQHQQQHQHQHQHQQQQQHRQLEIFEMDHYEQANFAQQQTQQQHTVINSSFQSHAQQQHQQHLCHMQQLPDDISPKHRSMAVLSSANSQLVDDQQHLTHHLTTHLPNHHNLDATVQHFHQVQHHAPMHSQPSLDLSTQSLIQSRDEFALADHNFHHHHTLQDDQQHHLYPESDQHLSFIPSYEQQRLLIDEGLAATQCDIVDSKPYNDALMQPAIGLRRNNSGSSPDQSGINAEPDSRAQTPILSNSSTSGDASNLAQVDSVLQHASEIQLQQVNSSSNSVSGQMQADDVKPCESASQAHQQSADQSSQEQVHHSHGVFSEWRRFKSFFYEQSQRLCHGFTQHNHTHNHSHNHSQSQTPNPNHDSHNSATNQQRQPNGAMSQQHQQQQQQQPGQQLAASHDHHLQQSQGEQQMHIDAELIRYKPN